MPYLFKPVLNKVLSQRKPAKFLLASITFGWNFRPYAFIFPILASIVFVIIHLLLRVRKKCENK